MENSERMKNIAENRFAFHQYHIMEKWEAGIVLLGTEVKSLREGRVNIKDSFVRFVKGAPYLFNLHITPYSHTASKTLEATRERKLLLHDYEIRKIFGHLTQRGLTCVPLRLYFKKGRAKAEIALCKGKQLYDKRRDLKERIQNREIDRAVKGRRRNP
jgi:SsrA-binding protein